MMTFYINGRAYRAEYAPEQQNGESFTSYRNGCLVFGYRPVDQVTEESIYNPFFAGFSCDDGDSFVVLLRRVKMPPNLLATHGRRWKACRTEDTRPPLPLLDESRQVLLYEKDIRFFSC